VSRSGTYGIINSKNYQPEADTDASVSCIFEYALRQVAIKKLVVLPTNLLALPFFMK
jgi:hypothetical protein